MKKKGVATAETVIRQLPPGQAPYMVERKMMEGHLLPERVFHSRNLESKKTVRIYLPPSYDSSPRRRYPVLYIHDGQNVFSSAGPDACFGWGSWELDRTVDGLVAAKKMREIIMVAVDNSRFRYQEYRGPAASSDSRRFKQYAQFLARELKPRIDDEFRTMPKPAYTGLLGSSLGGICSLAIAWEHPAIFGLAASLSGSFQVEKRYFLKKVLSPHKRPRKPIRIYLDSGVRDFDGDDDGRADTEAVTAELRRIGWKDDVNLKHYVDTEPLDESGLERAGVPHYKWGDALQSQHNEFNWRIRAWRALTFLFPPLKR
jgi:predicted alpha/beta superfamily hydrolase